MFVYYIQPEYIYIITSIQKIIKTCQNYDRKGQKNAIEIFERTKTSCFTPWSHIR